MTSEYNNDYNDYAHSTYQLHNLFDRIASGKLIL